MREAIGTSLRDALDTYRRKKVDDFAVQMTKLKDMGISPT
jgi:hypothetical protein